MYSFKKMMKVYRAVYDMSALECADLIGVTVDHYYQLISGKRFNSPGIDRIEKLSIHAGIKLWELVALGESS